MTHRNGVFIQEFFNCETFNRVFEDPDKIKINFYEIMVEKENARNE